LLSFWHLTWFSEFRFAGKLPDFVNRQIPGTYISYFLNTLLRGSAYCMSTAWDWHVVTTPNCASEIAQLTGAAFIKTWWQTTVQYQAGAGLMSAGLSASYSC
jgi:hypothetical protein